MAEHQDSPRDEAPRDEPPPPSTATAPKSWMRREIPRGRWLAVLGLVAVLAAGAVLAFQMAPRWREQAERSRIETRETPPDEWKGIRFGMTRREFAEMLVASGVDWSSIAKPGTGPTPWAAHVRLEVNGHRAREFSVRFSDGQRWDYGRHPESSTERVDVDRLIGGLAPDARLNGINWKVETSDYDVEHETVPVEVLRALGQPHSAKPDVTGYGKLHLWDWPTLKGFYYSLDGSVTLQTPEALGATYGGDPGT